MKDIVIIGSSSLAKEIAFLIEDINRKKQEWNFLGFVDENKNETIGKHKVVLNDEELLDYKSELYVLIGVGFPNLLKRLATKFLKNKHLIFPNIIHPNCIGDWDRIEFEQGNIITAGNIFTTDITIGSFNIFNLNGTVGHDTSVSDFNIFNPSSNISGNVIIKDEVLIGTGAQVLQNIEINSNIIIGAGSVVTKSLTESGTYVGSPAKRIK